MRLTIAVALLALSSPSFSQTASSAATAHEGEKTTFASPMVIDTVFAAADHRLWESADPGASGKWFTVDEYHGIGRFECDGVSLRSDYNRKRQTWETGLQLSARKEAGGGLEVKVRTTIENAKGNHDKRVGILFEVMNGDEMIAKATSRPVGLEGGDEKNTTVTIAVPDVSLKTNPMTKLRMTVTVADD